MKPRFYLQNGKVYELIEVQDEPTYHLKDIATKDIFIRTPKQMIAQNFIELMEKPKSGKGQING